MYCKLLNIGRQALQKIYDILKEESDLRCIYIYTFFYSGISDIVKEVFVTEFHTKLVVFLLNSRHIN